MPPRVLATMVTTTSYGTWLPGDARGYVENGKILPADPKRYDQARQRLVGDPVHFTAGQQGCLFEALRRAAIEFGYRLTDVSLESWHVHWILDHGFDPVKDMVGRLKTRIRQALAIGRVWTDGYCHRCFDDEGSLVTARAYIGRHPGCRMTTGQVRPRNTPGGAGGYGISGIKLP